MSNINEFAYGSILKSIKQKKFLVSLNILAGILFLIGAVLGLFKGNYFLGAVDLTASACQFILMRWNMIDIKRMKDSIVEKEKEIQMSNESQKKNDFYKKELEFFKNM